ncbi:asparagine synthase (glutamine-hydrolyzing) [Methylophilales bacterium]|nr:asparagine synthase (glutamine-hydrolyzing) [Methylophilales bacterium]
MCGIFGIISTKKISQAECINSVNSLRHRGPDDSGWTSLTYKRKHSIFLGHTRLSVQDLSDSGCQPMSTSDKRYTIIFNGEIYNFNELRNDLKAAGVIFSGSSDTEVILQLFIRYGLDCVEKLSGMFAFVILDNFKGEITIARDRFGKKPLYYYLDNENFVFASELNSILELNRIKSSLSVDKTSINQILITGFIHGQSSIFNEIKKINPSTIAVFSIKRMDFIDSKIYWSVENYNNSSRIFQEPSKEMERLLDKSVGDRLVSDVPICMFLSGGVDSSLVYSKALMHMPDMEAFTISYKNYKNDESDFAKQVARSLKGKLNIVDMNAKQFSDSAESMLNILDEPVADAAMIPLHYLSKIVGNRYKVALSGDGGDEIFGGYIKYPVQEYIEKTPQFIRNFIASLLKNTNSISLKRLASGLKLNFNERQFIFGSGGFLIEEMEELLENKNFNKKAIFASVSKANQPFLNDPFLQSMYLDTLFQLPDWYLFKADRASMANGLELRSPLLDHKIAELSFSFSSSEHKKFLSKKILLKKMLAKNLPSHLVNRKKLGFAVDLDSWVSSKSSKEIILSDSNSNIFNKVWLQKNLNFMSPLAKFKIISINYYLLKHGF